MGREDIWACFPFPWRQHPGFLLGILSFSACWLICSWFPSQLLWWAHSPGLDNEATILRTQELGLGFSRDLNQADENQNQEHNPGRVLQDPLEKGSFLSNGVQ